MPPNANDETTPGEAGQATVQAPAAVGPSEHRDGHAAQIGALPATSGAAPESALAAVLANAPAPVGAGAETRIKQASGLVMTAAASYYGEDSKAALAAQAVLLKKMEAPPAEDALQLQRIGPPSDTVVAVAPAASGSGAAQSDSTNGASDHSDGT
ncbi:hypothetical protein [Xanthomonas sp. CFBP 8445]|uniref:hypothetical protein n=1 Tax=Xanthomonas sp. CFBP 8445 TaxID=2971236 RepID=UPI0021E01451|nr:hypothetical protein [Xanthomonas sp. CFBP 8445]UYC13356.1 hypothetical protein NUG21_06340 [Xanthomonas sp. CFBP 8445]